MAQFDPNSLSNPNKIKVKHLAINVTADFEKKTLKGHVDVTAQAVEDVNELILDAKMLHIYKVSNQENNQQINFHLGNEHEVFGKSLHIPVTVPAGKSVTVRIEYETSPGASALQWLVPSQTAGKKYPYLFSQCQAIHARTMVPCQDTPYVKASYDATITVPKELTALMSAASTGSSDSGDGKHKSFNFKQKIPIPSYLIALAVGHLVSKDIGPRSKVWSEPEMVDAGAFEFSETENFIKIAEDLVGPYIWNKYDILLLPPSFPYGGMENPELTFVTPTLLAGDRSNADVVAHEISHSWTGNLVTTKSWEHFWLNEGCTMYLERKILEKIHGRKYFHFDAKAGWKHLQDDIDHFGKENPLTALVPKLDNIDPDDAFSSVPYEKGFTLLFYLEGVVGGPDVFIKFFRAWIEEHHHQCLTSQDFKQFFLNFYKGKVDQAKLDAINWEGWFNTPGMPIVKPDFDDTLGEAASALADKWIKHNGGDNPSSNDFANWTPKQLNAFLDKLLESEKPIPVESIEKMDKIYKFTSSKNAEIRFRWYSLGLKVNWEPCVDPAIEFITTQGRMKYVRPLYRALYASTVGKQKALDAFAKHKDSYHSICSKMVAKDLQLS